MPTPMNPQPANRATTASATNAQWHDAKNTGVNQTSFAGESSDDARFGHDATYRRLRGKLEYLQSSGDWKLRYIPIDGATDDYGGSVVISNPEALGHVTPGEYVAVEGEVIASAGDGSFSPIFKLARAVPLAD